MCWDTKEILRAFFGGSVLCWSLLHVRRSRSDFERQRQRDRLDCNHMTKLIALVAAGLFAAGTMFAGEHGDCTKQVGNNGKMACDVSMASLNLTPEQKTKMDTAMAEHEKTGCTEA